MNRTRGRWPWKSESAKDCVTTHLPNVLALKMDGAQAYRPYPAPRVETMPWGVGGRGGLADLGGSSKYFNENLKDRSGERFHLRFKVRTCAPLGEREAGQYSCAWMWVLRGNATERGDGGGGPGQSYLFFLTACHPGNSLSGDRVVLITAAGLQGEQPLVDRTMIGSKGWARWALGGRPGSRLALAGQPAGASQHPVADALGRLRPSGARLTTNLELHCDGQKVVLTQCDFCPVL
ncbi:hypothetical protein FJTKL_04550 [Diaporthe vaccinii]|uniref:Uncharacterized protein n=1 Tax=Diaporthe vaccinii TaxID=105482 RepID=A0ABR4DTF7_9PEZI